jgi:pSer/pThr/pTyr-binding forkhead associated (FHA) protein
MPAPTGVGPSARGPGRRGVEETEQVRAAPGPAASVDDDVHFPRLVALNTIFAGLSFPLKATENVLGRTEDNDVVIEHRSISRNHAKFVRVADRVQVFDLKSANGVLVNGSEVEQHTLRTGDVVELGRIKLRFVPVGERFSLAADEIERARLADAGGDEFEDGSKTTMITTRGSTAPTTTRRPVGLYVLLAVLTLVVVVLAVLLLSRGSTQADSATPGDPADAKLADDGARPGPASTTPSSATAGSPSNPPADSLPATPTGTASVGSPGVPAVPVPDESPPSTADAAAASAASPTTTTVTTPTPTTTMGAPAGAGDVAADAVIPPVGLDPASEKAAAAAAAKKPRRVDVEANWKAAFKAFSEGRLDATVSLLLETERAAPEDPRVQRLLTLAYAKKRDKEGARLHFKRLASLTPNDENVAKLREQLEANGIPVR